MNQKTQHKFSQIPKWMTFFSQLILVKQKKKNIQHKQYSLTHERMTLKSQLFLENQKHTAQQL